MTLIWVSSGGILGVWCFWYAACWTNAGEKKKDFGLGGLMCVVVLGCEGLDGWDGMGWGWMGGFDLGVVERWDGRV